VKFSSSYFCQGCPLRLLISGVKKKPTCATAMEFTSFFYFQSSKLHVFGVCVCVCRRCWVGGVCAHNSFLLNRSQQHFPVIPADSSSPEVRTRPLGVTKCYRNLRGHLTAFWTSNLARWGVKTYSFSCLNPPWPLYDLTAETDFLRLQSSTVNTRTGICRG
jgi:hypothetical protein